MGFTTAYAESISISSSQILSRDNNLVLATGGADGIVVTLYPAQNGDTLAVTVVKVDSGAGSVQVIGNNINVTLTAQNQTVSAQFTGTGWQEFATTGAGGGGGGTPGTPPLSLQAASADGTTFIGVPNSIVDPVTGAASFLNGAFSLIYDAGNDATSIGLSTGNPPAAASIGAATSELILGAGRDGTPTGSGAILEEGSDVGISIDATGQLGYSGSGTGPLNLTGAGTITFDDSARASGSKLDLDSTASGVITASTIINAVGGYQANGVEGISGTGPALTAVTVTNGLITAATFTP